MSQLDTLKYLDKCIEDLKNTPYQEYKDIEKGLDFNKIYNDNDLEIYGVPDNLSQVHYICVWDKYGNTYNSMYKDLVFFNKEKAQKLCESLNYESDELEYEVYSAWVGDEMIGF